MTVLTHSTDPFDSYTFQAETATFATKYLPYPFDSCTIISAKNASGSCNWFSK